MSSTDEPRTGNASLSVLVGGALRCCIESLSTAPAEQIDAGLVPCRYCTSRMEVVDGSWTARWD